jgi:hypothetical protein
LLRLDEINKNEVILIADPDYEEQEIYNFEVRAVSAAGKSSSWKPVTFSILPINEPASFSSDPLFTVDENQLAIGSVTATDPEGVVLEYSISDTETGSELEIDDLGAITFADAPNFETDAKLYKATVTVTDGPNDTTQEITVTLGDVNEPAVFSSTPSFTADENQLAIGSVTATDPEGVVLEYSISDTETGSELEIDDLGAITFADAPNFETDAKLYKATVTVTDGPNDTTQEITVTLGDVNEPAVFSSTPSFTADENQLAIGRVTATDPEDATLSYSISNTETGSELEIEELTGVITFAVEPDYENVLAIKSYKATVTVSDGPNDTTQEITVTLEDVDEIPPVITIKGPNPMSINKDLVYFEHGANATDNKPGIGNIRIDDSAVVESTAGTYLVYYDVTDAVGLDAATVTRTVVVQPEPIEVKGYAGRIWMDRNLGAKDKAENQTENNPDSYGHQYQWGRDSDGHESREHQVTTPIPLAIGAEGNDFVTGSSSWLESIALNRWNEIEDYLPYKGEHDPCPIGYRLPSKDEVDQEIYWMEKSNDKWNNKLKLPFTGWRTIPGVRGMERTHGRYWAGTAEGTSGTFFQQARSFQITRIDEMNNGIFVNRVSVGLSDVGFGFSVRCIQQLPDENQEHED